MIPVKQFFQEMADEINRILATLPTIHQKWQFLDGVNRSFGGPGVRPPGRRHPAGRRPKKKPPVPQGSGGQ